MTKVYHIIDENLPEDVLQGMREQAAAVVQSSFAKLPRGTIKTLKDGSRLRYTKEGHWVVEKKSRLFGGHVSKRIVSADWAEIMYETD